MKDGTAEVAVKKKAREERRLSGPAAQRSPQVLACSCHRPPRHNVPTPQLRAEVKQTCGVRRKEHEEGVKKVRLVVNSGKRAAVKVRKKVKPKVVVELAATPKVWGVDRYTASPSPPTFSTAFYGGNMLAGEGERSRKQGFWRGEYVTA